MWVWLLKASRRGLASAWGMVRHVFTLPKGSLLCHVHTPCQAQGMCLSVHLSWVLSGGQKKHECLLSAFDGVGTTELLWSVRNMASFQADGTTRASHQLWPLWWLVLSGTPQPQAAPPHGLGLAGFPDWIHKDLKSFGWGHLETPQQDTVGCYSPTIVPAPPSFTLSQNWCEFLTSHSKQGSGNSSALSKALLTLKGT